MRLPEGEHRRVTVRHSQRQRHAGRKETAVKQLVRSRRVLAAVLAFVFAAAAVGAAFTTSSAGASGALPDLLTAAPKPATKAQWAKIVAAAKKEGSVTLYTSQNPVFLADTAKAFEKKYGIKLTVNRQIDSVLTQQVNAEKAAGKLNVDVWVIASLPVVLGAQKPQNQWLVNAVGPDLYVKAYDRKLFGGPGKANIVGEAVLGIAWNPSQHSKGLKDLPDLLDPALKGRIGAVIPSAPSLVDWYHWVEETYGKNFVVRLSQQNPKLYASSLPMTQAVVSGEISAGSFIAANAVDLHEQGAPINFLVPKGQKGWNAPWWGMVMKGSPHPNAAQVLMNYLVTKEGQQTSAHRTGAVLKGVSQTFYLVPRKQNLKELTPAKVTEYQNYWNGLFRK
jgi:iron(III) transport system substrate-binding protein